MCYLCLNLPTCLLPAPLTHLPPLHYPLPACASPCLLASAVSHAVPAATAALLRTAMGSREEGKEVHGEEHHTRQAGKRGGEGTMAEKKNHASSYFCWNSKAKTLAVLDQAGLSTTAGIAAAP